MEQFRTALEVGTAPGTDGEQGMKCAAAPVRIQFVNIIARPLINSS